MSGWIQWMTKLAFGGGRARTWQAPRQLTRTTNPARVLFGYRAGNASPIIPSNEPVEGLERRRAGRPLKLAGRLKARFTQGQFNHLGRRLGGGANRGARIVGPE